MLMIRIRRGRAYRPSPPAALWGLALGRLRHEESRTALACVDLWVVGVSRLPLGAARAGPAALSSICWLSHGRARFDGIASLMAHQREPVRSKILGFTIQVKPKFTNISNRHIKPCIANRPGVVRDRMVIRKPGGCGHGIGARSCGIGRDPTRGHRHREGRWAHAQYLA